MIQTNVFEEMIFLGKGTKEKEVFGKKFVFSVLEGGDYTKMFQEISGQDDTTRVQCLKIKTLSRAVKSIEGHEFRYTPKDGTDEITLDKTMKQFEVSISHWAQNVIDMAYTLYAQTELEALADVLGVKPDDLSKVTPAVNK